MAHERFHYRSLAELQAKLAELDLRLPLSQRTEILWEPLRFGEFCLPNRLGTAPMEGADGLEDGSPSELTLRRYLRAAEGGSAVIWFEAISIVPEGRSSRTQLWLNKQNADAYRRMVAQVKEAGLRANGFAPFLVMQANHSGRYSNPDNRPAPLIAYRHPELERYRAADERCIVSDDYLKGLEESFGEAAKLAKAVGFDAVDIKSCHGYLLAELSSAYTRPGSYGGSYENRTRLLKNAVMAARVCEDRNFAVTARLGIYDGYAWPYGFGVSSGQGLRPDYTEPIRLAGELHEVLGLKLINLTMGNPYASTHVTRPFDAGMYVPKEHPLEGVARMLEGIATVKRAVPGLCVLGSAPSYLRQYADLYSAGAVESGSCDGMLFGRLSFADPDFPNDIRRTGRIDAGRVCLSCGKCGELIRAHLPTGCVIRDTEQFMPYYQEFLKRKPGQPANFRG